MNRTVEDSLTVGTSLGRAFRYLLFGAAAILIGLAFCGCQTQQPPDGWESPPVKYGAPLPPAKTPSFQWRVGEYDPPNRVRIEWDYPESNMAFIVFRVYASYSPHWDTNWTGWWLLGQTEALAFTNDLIGDARFFTITASNTLTGLESDPARRE